MDGLIITKAPLGECLHFACTNADGLACKISPRASLTLSGFVGESVIFPGTGRIMPFIHCFGLFQKTEDHGPLYY